MATLLVCLVAMSLIGVVGQCFLPRGRRLSSPFFRNCRTCAAFLLVMRAGKSGLTLLLPCSRPGEADYEAAAANPQEDGACGHRPLFLGSRFIKKALALSGHKFKRSTLLDEALICVKQHIAHPHIFHCLLPELVGGLPWTLGTRVSWRRPLCIGKIIKHAATYIIFGGANDIDDSECPGIHLVRRAHGRLHPFGYQPWVRCKGVCSIKGAHGRGQMRWW